MDAGKLVNAGTSLHSDPPHLTSHRPRCDVLRHHAEGIYFSIGFAFHSALFSDFVQYLSLDILGWWRTLRAIIY